MKQLVIALLLVAVTAGYAQAQIDPDDDGIGVYADPCAGIPCIDLPAGDHIIYLVITHPTAPMGILGWECTVTYDGPGFVRYYEILGQHVNIGTQPEFIVGLAEPAINPVSYPSVPIAMIHLTLTDVTDPMEFYVGSTWFHSLPDPVPAYIDAGTGETKELQQSTGGPDTPVFSINGDCVVDAETETWGGIKALYH